MGRLKTQIKTFLHQAPDKRKSCASNLTAWNQEIRELTTKLAAAGRESLQLVLNQAICDSEGTYFGTYINTVQLSMKKTSLLNGCL